MMGPGMFDGIVTGLIVIGVILGVLFAGVIWLGVWFFSHASFTFSWA